MQLLAILSTSVLSSRRQTRAWATVASRSAYNVSSLFSPGDHYIQGSIGVPKRCDKSQMLVHHARQEFASGRSVKFVPGRLIHQTQSAVSAIHASDRYQSMGWDTVIKALYDRESDTFQSIGDSNDPDALTRSDKGRIIPLSIAQSEDRH